MVAYLMPRLQLDMGVHPRDFVQVKYVDEANMLDIFLRLLPTLMIVGMMAFMMRGAAGGPGGGMGKIMSIGKVKPADKTMTSKVTFKDVAGCDEAKVRTFAMNRECNDNICDIRDGDCIATIELAFPEFRWAISTFQEPLPCWKISSC